MRNCCKDNANLLCSFQFMMELRPKSQCVVLKIQKAVLLLTIRIFVFLIANNGCKGPIQMLLESLPLCLAVHKLYFYSYHVFISSSLLNFLFCLSLLFHERSQQDPQNEWKAFQPPNPRLSSCIFQEQGPSILCLPQALFGTGFTPFRVDFKGRDPAGCADPSRWVKWCDPMTCFLRNTTHAELQCTETQLSSAIKETGRKDQSNCTVIQTPYWHVRFPCRNRTPGFLQTFASPSRIKVLSSFVFSMAKVLMRHWKHKTHPSISFLIPFFFFFF